MKKGAIFELQMHQIAPNCLFLNKKISREATETLDIEGVTASIPPHVALCALNAAIDGIPVCS